MNNTKPNDGGPAFPHTTEGEYSDPQTCTHWHPYLGMSLRDYFAGQALSGVTSIPAFYTNIIEAQIKKPGREKATVGECVAFYCYDMADAMLKARNS